MKSTYLLIHSVILCAGIIYLVLAYGDDIYSFAIIMVLGIVNFIMFLLWPHFFAAHTKTDGMFIFDTSDPHKDTITIMYDQDPLSLSEKDYVIFDVERR